MANPNLEYWLYDTKSVTPWYFWPPPKQNSIDKLRSLWVVEPKEEVKQESTLLKQIKKKTLWDKAKEAASFVTEPLQDIWAGFRILGSDISKLQRWELDKTEWLLGKFLQAGEMRTERIKQLNDDIDASWGSELDKTIATGLNIFGAWVDFTWDALVSALKTIAPQWVEDFTAEKMQAFWQSEVGQQIAEFIKKWGWAVDNFADSSPEASRLVNSFKSVLPLVEAATGWAWGKLLKESVDVVSDATAQGIKQAWEATKDALGNTIPKIQNAASSVKQKVSNFTPYTPWSLSQKIAGIDDITKTTLQRADTDSFDTYIQAWKDAIQDIKNPTPLDLAWDKAIETIDIIKQKRSEIGARKAEILKNIETQTIPTKDIYDDFNEFLWERFNLQIDWKTLNLVEIPWKKANIWDSSIKDLQGMSDELLDLFTSNDINLWNLDATVDRIQDGINFNKLDRPWGNASKTEKQISSFLEGSINQRLKNAAWQDFIDANDDFRRIIDMQDRLERLLWKDLNRWGSLMKAVFSPTDRWTKRLFSEIEEEFGIDLTTEAGLAKFAMQVSWDPRQASLLEALDLGQDFTKKLSWKLEWTLLAPAASILWTGTKKVFNPETVWRQLTK